MEPAPRTKKTPKRVEALQNSVKPYLQLVIPGEPDQFTNLLLGDVWRHDTGSPDGGGAGRPSHCWAWPEAIRNVSCLIEKRAAWSSLRSFCLWAEFDCLFGLFEGAAGEEAGGFGGDRDIGNLRELGPGGDSVPRSSLLTVDTSEEQEGAGANRAVGWRQVLC